MNNLKSILKNINITQFDLANELKIKSLSTINQKLNKKSEFTLKEAKIIRDLIKKRTGKIYTIEELFSEDGG